MTSECPCCGRVFDSRRGMTTHKTQAHNRIEPWEDKTTMEYLYVTKRMSAAEVADVLPCNEGHVKRWLRRHGIERTHSEGAKLRGLKQHPHHRWHNGYEQVVTTNDGEQVGVQIHRLVAVAEYGFDAVEGNVIHHKNEIKWDNRPCNIEPMSRKQHQQKHIQDRNRSKNGQVQ